MLAHLFGASGAVEALITTLALINGSLGLFPMLFIFMLAPEFFIPMRTLTSLFHVAMTGVSAAENIISFVDSPERNTDGNKEFELHLVERRRRNLY